MSLEEQKEKLIGEIVERELAMFLATPNEGGTSDYQTRPDTFRIMRRMNHCVHGVPMLESYLQDLEEAAAQGRNLMTEKYALMDDRIPLLTQRPLPLEIAVAETGFLQQATAWYPHAVQASGDDAFCNYCRCELETLSDRTLELYAEEVKQAISEERNLAVERYDFLWKLLGEGSLEAYEAKLAANDPDSKAQ